MEILLTMLFNPRAYVLFVFFTICISAQAQQPVQAQKSIVAQQLEPAEKPLADHNEGAYYIATRALKPIMVHYEDSTYISARSEKPVVVHNQDSTYTVSHNSLGEVNVMAKRYNPNTSLSNVIKSGKITTSVNGLTKDLQRDLPSTIRFYTPQGIPILTKYTSNNSLTSSIPDGAATLELREASAKFPNPDVPIILKSNYGKTGNVSLSPLTQTMNAGSGTEQAVAANLALSHSGPPGVLTNQVPELNAYSTTFSGFGAVQAKTSGTETELIFHHSQSANEYGNLLNIQEFYEDNHNTNISLSHAVSLGSATFDAGIISQNGREFRSVKEKTKSEEIINEIQAVSYTAGLSNNKTEIRANYHDFSRTYSWPVDTVRQQRLESVVTHTQSITKDIDVTLESRFDFRDLEPSLSGNLDIQATRNIGLTLNAGRLYDAVGSEGLANLMNSVQISPHPWTVTYGSFDANLKFNSVNINTSVMHKTLERGWYGPTADISGWVGRMGANGLLFWDNQNNSYLKWNYEGVARKLTLGLQGHDLQPMPGPAKFQQHISLEAGFGSMQYALQLDSYFDRHIRIDQILSANLGPQHFLSIDASRKIGAIQLGLTLHNLLALWGTENYFAAHGNNTENLSYVSAPPFFDLSLRIDLF